MVTDTSESSRTLPSLLPFPVRRLDLGAAGLPVPGTPLIGRERELNSLVALLTQPNVRLLTLTGPGGVGKTRLAIRVAEEVVERFADGVAFVPLAAISAPDLVVPTIFQALGGRDDSADTGVRLHHSLSDRALLLVLDNFEHLEPAATAIGELLDACPRLKVLTTSRTALRLSREREFLVPPLSLPDVSASVAPDAALRSDAVRLFIQRASVTQTHLAATPEVLPAISAICHRLDGLPLAIELAAARVAHLSPGALLTEFDRPGTSLLPLLSDGTANEHARLRTMRDTIAWSYDLLHDDEQRLFRELSVFVGGFTLEAAEYVGGKGEREDEVETSSSSLPPGAKRPPLSPFPPSVLDGIAALVDDSLARYEDDPGGAPRYGMLETIRQFGLERLAASGQEESVRQHHAAWCLSFAERAGPMVKGPDAAFWLQVLEREHSNLRAALTWLATRKDGVLLARLTGALWSFWQERGHYREGRQWLEAALDMSQEVPAQDRLHLLTGAGTIAWHQLDFAQAIHHHERALALAREVGDREAEAFALNNLGVQAKDMGDFETARQRYEACIAIAGDAGMTLQLIRGLHNLAQIQRLQGDSGAALRTMEDVLLLARDHAMNWAMPQILLGLGLAATDAGDFPRAIALFHESLSLAADKRNPGNIIDGLECVAKLAAVTGQADEATRLYGAAQALREELDYPLSPAETSYAEPVIQGLREALGAAGFIAVWASGQALPLDQVLATALAFRLPAVDRRTLPIGHHATTLGLTARELEVLRHLAAGHSTHEISERLVISRMTVARHVSNLKEKLGVNSRSKAVAYAHQHGLV